MLDLVDQLVVLKALLEEHGLLLEEPEVQQKELRA